MAMVDAPKTSRSSRSQVTWYTSPQNPDRKRRDINLYRGKLFWSANRNSQRGGLFFNPKKVIELYIVVNFFLGHFTPPSSTVKNG
jgi:hypothetical protein